MLRIVDFLADGTFWHPLDKVLLGGGKLKEV